ncbi:DUF1801 domain-containing protein [Sphingobacterium composti Ten et al. 2007 non Yoo et al. 2007]|uniref:DUF1801 domain-containing protein n=1 Tax=Sphingobacterium composti TaxID=363260 RepID=UPI0019151C88|nr:DUF1801 domain-containing protein [Sphingobacterium composti Ten et al. 2007 non Yoo et al. 2007]
MNTNFQNIDEYIALQDPEHQKKLQDLRKIILEFAPAETKETISYGMPTFRYNGNLIHFAQFKNHLGLYPGPNAIEACQNYISGLKTSKGTIQIPNNTPINNELVKNLVQFNVTLLKNKIKPDWTKYREQWSDIYEKMSQLILKTNLKKEIKWGMDIYTHEGKNVIGWGGFKNFFSIWFYNGVFLSDPYNVLVAATEGKTKSLRQWRLKSCDEFDERKILEYIQETIQTIKDGKFIPSEKSTTLQSEGILKDVLLINKELQTAFNKLTLGKQKDYINYINEAKQEKTKLSRLDKITPMILAGIGLNDKYKRK